VPIFNCNELAQSDWVSPQQSYQGIADKAKAYGFIVRVIDGHDPIEIGEAFNELNVVKNGHRPLCIVARTIKGWGSPSEQGMGHHGTPVKKDKLAATLGELDATAKDLGVGDYKVGNELKITPPPATQVKFVSPMEQPVKAAGFAEGLAMVGLDKDLAAKKPIAPRKAYGAALVALGAADKRIIGLDADVKNSTHAEWFAKKFPAQYLECKIAEQNMVSVAAGAAAAGKIPFCSTFAKFFERAYDQIEMAINSGANFKMTGSHAGVTLAADGPSQMSLPDAAFFRAFTKVKDYHGRTAVHYFFPADAVSAYKITHLMANIVGCCYLRTLRAEVPLLYPAEEKFEAGGHKVVREGKDAVFVAAGYMVHECLKAADELKKGGKSATVIDAYALPLKSEVILELAQKNGGRIITVEDNYAGGLEAEIATAIATTGAAVKLKALYVTNIPKSGREPQDVLDYLHLGYKGIAGAV
jgi:transketolase